MLLFFGKHLVVFPISSIFSTIGSLWWLSFASSIIWDTGIHRNRFRVGSQKLQHLSHPREISTNPQLTGFLISGILMFIVGLFVAIAHRSFAIFLVGTERIITETLTGGSSRSDAELLFLFSGIIVLILGVGLLFYGLIPIIKKN